MKKVGIIGCGLTKFGEHWETGFRELAVEAGYWPMFRYDPRLADEGKNPFQLDYKEPNGKIREFLMGEVRYHSLTKSFPEEAEKLHKALAEGVVKKYNRYKNMADQ